MHELSLAHSLVQSVVDALGGNGHPRVRAVRLRVGVLSGVAAEALEFCYEVVTKGTSLEGSRLDVVMVPLVLHCPACDREVEPTAGWRFRCPVCDTPTGSIVHGKELEIESVEVEDCALWKEE